MHFAVNAHLLSPVTGYRQAGVSGYIERLLRQLLPLSPTDRWTVYTSAGITPARLAATPNTTLRPSRLPTTNPLVRILWEQLCAPLLLARDRPSVLFCPLNVVPLAAPCPTVVTIHDLAFLRLPERFRPAKRRYLTLLTSLSVRRARHVITVSDFTRREVIELLHVPPEHVTAIPNGRDETLSPPEPAAVAAFRQRHALPPAFLLFVGTLEPRKNLLTLLRAYAEVRDRIKLPLIIAGGKGWLYEPIFALVDELELGEHVRFTGYVDQADLPLWYGAATASIYPSLYEGFGFPPLEAMQCGTPVITSNTTSLPEVVGDAALLIDPHDVAALAAALLRIATDPALRADLRARGLARAQHFDWHYTATATLNVLRTAAHPVP
ncbi:MAG: glycosyltransferase family 4 protein [Herpetosiphonaceae bacterium]|nr:glycosyltransferase family 4 protein [Herpetosiphonaceae bacterium]